MEAPYSAAQAGVTDNKRLYTIYTPNDRFDLALPILDNPDVVDPKVLGVGVIILDALPTRTDVPWHVFNIVGRSLLVFLFAIGIMGAIFGAFFARSLSARFNHIPSTIDAWSGGNFSTFIDDTTGDEISKFAQRLNNMARQLLDLLRKRQEMAVS